LAESNKAQTRSKATKHLLALSQHRISVHGVNLQDAGINRAKEEIDVASLQATEEPVMGNCRVGDRRRVWEGRSVIASTVAVVVLGIVLGAMSSLP
jgi:hypothetical protein